jgi:hypothetical protein
MSDFSAMHPDRKKSPDSRKADEKRRTSLKLGVILGVPVNELVKKTTVLLGFA